MAYTTINKPNLHFNTVTYTGTGSNQTISVGFTPDFWWIKSRSAATNNRLYNQVASGGYLVSNSTAAQVASGTVAQTAGGFIIGTDGDVNTNGATYVGWNWLASNTTTSNTQGSITSTVSANTTAGFSIVSYTGTGSNATVGHGLGVAPKMVIVKSRSNSTDWIVGNTNIGWTKLLRLNTTDAQETNNYFNDTAPTSSVFSLGTTVNVNGSGYTYVAYCFAEVKGFSKFGSYTGNGSTNGTFVYTGFKPAWVVVKNITEVDGWILVDNKRNTFNVETNYLLPNSSSADASATISDFLSNGFKLREGYHGTNASGQSYIYMAFAENPLVGTNNVPATAR